MDGWSPSGHEARAKLPSGPCRPWPSRRQQPPRYRAAMDLGTWCGGRGSGFFSGKGPLPEAVPVAARRSFPQSVPPLNPRLDRGIFQCEGSLALARALSGLDGPPPAALLRPLLVAAHRSSTPAGSEPFCVAPFRSTSAHPALSPPFSSPGPRVPEHLSRPPPTRTLCARTLKLPASTPTTSPCKETEPLLSFALAGLVLALIVTVAALVRQVRIRRALEMLLRRILERIAWSRARPGPVSPNAPSHGAPSQDTPSHDTPSQGRHRRRRSGRRRRRPSRARPPTGRP